MESGAIPDSQFTSSSVQSPEYGPQYSRLNSRSGGGAWCARSCDPSEYLQIDLGLVLLVREVSTAQNTFWGRVKREGINEEAFDRCTNTCSVRMRYGICSSYNRSSPEPITRAQVPAILALS